MLSHYLTRLISSPRGLNLRFLTIEHTKCSAQESPLYKLRQRTGLAYNLCREALNKHNNQIDQAEIWLKAQALALGLQKATKMRDRSAREGLIGLTITHDNQTATIVKLNCETDFVAKNQIFKDLALDLTYHASTLDPVGGHKTFSNHKIKMVPFDTQHLEDMSKQIVPVISKLGENIKVEEAYQLKVESSQINLFGQVHADNCERSSEDTKLLTGRFASIVGLEDLKTDSPRGGSLVPYGNRLCRHVIGYNPTYIELPQELRKKFEEVRHQVADAKKDQNTEDSDDSESEDNFISNTGDDWPSLMDQTLIMSDDITVRQFCDENEFSVIYFSRLVCGQSE